MSEEIKPVDYNELDCWAEEDAVCPYCEYENYVESEDYLGQDDEDIIECDDCGKNFVYRIDYSITFTSEPLENYYLNRKKMSLHRINNLKSRIKNSEDKEYFSYLLEHYERELKGFKERILLLLEEPK